MILEIKNLYFSYSKDKEVLSNLNLCLKKGEFAYLLGANGIGKTTLFKSILGFLPVKREIFIDEKRIEEYSNKERARKIAYIPQKSNLTFPYSVLSTVLMGTFSSLSTLSSPHKKEEDKALEILKQLGLYALKDKSIDHLSGGEQQLVMIARAMCQDAQLLLLDEITANLDFANQIKIYSLLSDLTKNGYTVLLSTHNPEAALNYGSKIIALDKGHIAFTGSPNDVMNSNILSSLYNTELNVQRITVNEKDHYLCFKE